MGRGAILVLMLLMPLVSSAWMTPKAPTSKAAFCQMHKNYGAVRALFFDPSNKLSFDNPSGFFDFGLCWWHSRLQRSAVYLTEFRPNEPKPTSFQAYNIINRIFRHGGVTVVPGFENLKAFSGAFEKEMIAYLSQMQLFDALEAWRGLRPMKATAQFIKTQVERIYKRVAIEDKVQYLALKGYEHWYVTHAWLIISAVKVGEKFEFYYLDSNDSPHVVPEKFTYAPGDTTLNGYIPYLQYDSDYWSIDPIVNRYCR